MSKRAPSAKGGRSDPALALRLFDRVFPSPSWLTWKACLASILGLPVSDEQAALIKQCMERASSPQRMAREIWILCGRRAGKSQIAALLAVYLACFKIYRASPGERLVGMLLAADRRQARILKGYISGLLHGVPELEGLIIKELQESIELSNGITIEIHTSSFRSVRGYSCIFVICDEIAFWPSDGPETDAAVLNALRPTLATTGGPLIALSTPYARVGVLFEAYQRHFGREDDDVFIWVAPSLVMNPSLDRAIVDRAYADDPDAAASEWGASFRSDLQSLFSRDALDACVATGRRELLPQAGIAYRAHCDTSGGSDESFTVCIVHKDHDGRAVVDLLREWPAPFDPSVVVAECAVLLRRYHCRSITGDRYSAEWVVSAFRLHNIEYKACELTKSELFIETLATINARQVDLLDDARLLAQFAGLQRRTGRSGKDSVDHRRGQRDDLANACAGALVAAVQSDDHATLPDTFRECYRAQSITSFLAEDCYLLGGRFKPPADICCKNCIGHQFVLSARRFYQERTGEAIELIGFYETQIAGNDWTAVRRANRWARDIGL